MPTDAHYHAKWKSITNVMKNNANLKIAAIARAGSRSRQSHGAKSDLDIIFTEAGNLSKSGIYEELIRIMKSAFPGCQCVLGSSGNVVKLILASGAKFDLVFLKEKVFMNQHGNEIDWRRKNL